MLCLEWRDPVRDGPPRHYARGTDLHNNITAVATGKEAADSARLTKICAPIVAVSGALIVGFGIWRMWIVPIRREARAQAERDMHMDCWYGR